MALTAAEKQRVLDALDKMDRWSLQRILDNVNSFADWLADQVYSIYVKVRDSIRSMWSWICGVFR
jgi:hypothetical protein